MVDLLKPCMICKKNMGVAACPVCGIIVCNLHIKMGHCFACAEVIKKTNFENKVRNV
ncbi:hypothetical protein J4208_06025 [Candidatus Woesearchaeota archaeon]|nr:hypothetical protein [Candidatus Woesearchaeota archaeon]